MARGILLPNEVGDLREHQTGPPANFPLPEGPILSRRAFAAAHVVANPLADNSPSSSAHLDWEATLSFRHHLWTHGLAVAEAMDTAQRGMGLDWPVTRELIRRSAAEATSVDGDIACGANTDQLEPNAPASIDQIIAAYEEQLEVIESSGAQPVIMASRHLAAAARGPEDYEKVYGRLLSQISRPAIVHWLGEMFDPALAGYWGASALDDAAEGFLGILAANESKVDGVKISLLDKDREIELRSRLPHDARMYTGDDFNYPELIRGDGQVHSDAFLGAFDVIAPAASAALQALDAGDADRFETILAPTVPLARHVFIEPTFYYKTGVVFMAYLCGHQDHFRMVSALEGARSAVHLAELFVLADAAGLLPDPELAVERCARVLAVAGVEQR
jgi:hypothetical protein